MSFDRVQGGLQAALSAVYSGLATVLWAPSEFPRAAADDLIVARLLSGPSPADGAQGGIGTYDLPQSATVTIAAPAAGERAVLEISGARWWHDVTAGQDAEAVRDALLAELADADGPAFDGTATASSTDAIALAASSTAGLVGLRVAGPATLATAGEITCAVQHQHAVSRIELQAFSVNRYPRSGAAALLSRFVERCRLPSVTELLERWGVALWGPPSALLDLTPISAGWESRAATQIQVATLSITAEAVDWIDAATLTLDAAEVEQITIEAPEEI